jgi:hypothetical protein
MVGSIVTLLPAFRVGSGQAARRLVTAETISAAEALPSSSFDMRELALVENHRARLDSFTVRTHPLFAKARSSREGVAGTMQFANHVMTSALFQVRTVSSGKEGGSFRAVKRFAISPRRVSATIELT